MSDKNLLQRIFIKYRDKKSFTSQWKGLTMYRYISKTKKVTTLIMPPAGLANKGFRKISMKNIGLLPGKTS